MITNDNINLKLWHERWWNARYLIQIKSELSQAKRVCCCGGRLRRCELGLLQTDEVCWWVIDSAESCGRKYHQRVNPPGGPMMSRSTIYFLLLTQRVIALFQECRSAFDSSGCCRFQLSGFLLFKDKKKYFLIVAGVPVWCWEASEEWNMQLELMRQMEDICLITD